jgi:hypothetical protein
LNDEDDGYYWSDSTGASSDNSTYYDTTYDQVEYVDKEGIKFDKYDPWEGPVKRYKEDEQDFATAAKKESDSEPLCKNRNQIIIVADNRVPQWKNTTNSSNSTTIAVKKFTTSNSTSSAAIPTDFNMIGMKAHTVEFSSEYKVPQVSGALLTRVSSVAALFMAFIAAYMA